MNFDDLFGRLCGHFFNIHAACGGSDHDRLLCGAVIGDGEIDFLIDGRGFVHKHFADGQAFDLHAQDLRGELFGFGGIFGNLYAACLAASAHQHLRFNNNAATQLFCNLSCFLSGSRNPSLWDRDAIL